MICPQCNQQNPDEAAYCSRCQSVMWKMADGSMVASAPQAGPAAATVAVPQLPLGEPHGIRGWLLLFWIGVMFLTPLANLAELLRSRDPIVWTIDLTISGLALASGIAIYQRKPLLFLLLKIYFSAQLFLGFIILLNNISKVASQTEAAETNLITGAKIIFYAAVWWAYFRKSERVRNTFGRNL